MEYIIAFGALIIGAVLSWLILNNHFLSKRQGLEKELEVNREKLNMASAELSDVSGRLEEERNKVSEMSRQIAVAAERERMMQEKYEEYKKEFEGLQAKFKLEFENVASKILKQNTLEFSISNQKSINEILSPFKQKIEDFEKTVNETYQKGVKEQVDLQVEIKKLYDLNIRLSEEANNLTRALKSDTKKQGNWGEMVLERLLERSGLEKGEEYLVQESYRNEKGELTRPDVIIRLPDNKHIIIDSKVSLTAYEAYISAETDEERTKYVKAHVESVKDHVKGLAEKSYQLTEKLDTPDFVLLFMPLESAFSLAVQHQAELFSFAWERKIVMVSPTTLLATLMTVGSIWKHEKQTRNALEIAVQGGRLYDKFVAFLADLETLGKQIDRVQATYDEAHKKLYSGKGDLIGRVEKLRALGAKTSREIPATALNQDDGTNDE